MRWIGAFVIGAAAGVCSVIAVQKLVELWESGEPTRLADRIQDRLEELEGRLSRGEEQTATT